MIELGGRETTSGRLAEIIKKAREHGVRVVFVQPQFNPASARALGEAIGGKDSTPLPRTFPRTSTR